jgi:hypothetical protein
MTVTSNNACGTATASDTYAVTVEPLPTANAGGGSATICENGTATVSGASASNGTILWTSNGDGSIADETTLTPTYTAASTDAGSVVTLTMTVTSNNACGTATASDTYAVTVNALPTVSVSGTSTICNGDPAVDFIFTGTPNAVVTYNVNGGLNTTIVLSGTGSATLSASNTVTSTVNLVSVINLSTSCSQAQTGSATVTVNPLPVITINTAAACDASLLTYTTIVDVSSGSVVTSPLANSVNNTAGDTWEVVANVGTDIVIIATNTTTTCEETLSISSPNCLCPPVSPPTSGGDVVYCVSDAIPALTASVPAGFTVNWYDATTGGTLLLSNNTSYTPLAAGTYYAESEEIVSGCLSTTRTPITLTADPLPTANAGGGSATICENGTATVSGASASNGTILWTSNGDGSITNETTLTPTYTAASTDAGSVVT